LRNGTKEVLNRFEFFADSRLRPDCYRLSSTDATIPQRFTDSKFCQNGSDRNHVGLHYNCTTTSRIVFYAFEPHAFLKLQLKQCVIHKFLNNPKGPSIKDDCTNSRKTDTLLTCPQNVRTGSTHLPIVRADAPLISKSPMFFAPKSADVRI